MNLLYQLPTPVIFAHRGASAYAPENTLASFKYAEDHGARAVELDVKLSRDGKIVVIHDANTQRTTGVDKWVNQENYEDLVRLNAGFYFSPNKTDEKIPLLEDVFDCLGKETLINIELTNYNSPGDALVEKTAVLVVKSGMQNHVMFSSFSPLNLIKIRRLLPSIPVGLLALEGRDGWWTRSLIGRWFFPAIIHPNIKDINPHTIAHEHQHKRRVHVWTVNQAEEIRNLFRLKVDGIFTDDPVLAKQILEDG